MSELAQKQVYGAPKESLFSPAYISVLLLGGLIYFGVNVHLLEDSLWLWLFRVMMVALLVFLVLFTTMLPRYHYLIIDPKYLEWRCFLIFHKKISWKDIDTISRDLVPPLFDIKTKDLLKILEQYKKAS